MRARSCTRPFYIWVSKDEKVSQKTFVDQNSHFSKLEDVTELIREKEVGKSFVFHQSGKLKSLSNLSKLIFRLK